MRKVKTVTNAIQTEVQKLYESWGYKPEDMIVLESARERVLNEQRQGVLSIVNAGNILLETKAAIPHGEWGGYITERLAMSADTAERLMASAKVVNKHPKLLELADRMRPTALYALARGKANDDDVVTAVIDSYADSNQEVTADKISDTVELVKPAAAKKEAKLPFKPIDEIMATDALARVDALIGEMAKRGTSVGLSYDKILKSSLFKAWLKTEGATQVLSVAAFVYFLQVSSAPISEAIDAESAPAGDGELFDNGEA